VEAAQQQDGMRGRGGGERGGGGGKDGEMAARASTSEETVETVNPALSSLVRTGFSLDGLR